MRWLRTEIATDKAVAELKGAGKWISNRGILINSSLVPETKNA
jgi:hypothetical protein